MRLTRIVSASLIAVVLTAGAVAASDKPAKVESKKETTKATEKSTPASSQFAILKDVKAVEMASAELDAIKGQHIHFVIHDPSTICPSPSCVPVIPNAAPIAGPHDGPIFEVNHKENNLGKGNALPGSGPGYSGMCGAALKSPAIWIPGQAPSGIGGGC